MDHPVSVVLAVVALAFTTGGTALLVTGAQWEIQETITIDGEPAEIRENGYVDPGRVRASPNQTVELTYSLRNPRPTAWQGPVRVFADTLDGAREAVDHVYVDRTVRLDPGEEATIRVQVVPRELGYTQPRPEGYRCACFGIVIEGPGEDHQLQVLLPEDDGGRPR